MHKTVQGKAVSGLHGSLRAGDPVFRKTKKERNGRTGEKACFLKRSGADPRAEAGSGPLQHPDLFPVRRLLGRPAIFHKLPLLSEKSPAALSQRIYIFLGQRTAFLVYAVQFGYGILLVSHCRIIIRRRSGNP
jgi:hypothetical protein